MSKPQDRTVFRRDKGIWVNKRNDAERASSVHSTPGWKPSRRPNNTSPIKAVANLQPWASTVGSEVRIRSLRGTIRVHPVIRSTSRRLVAETFLP